MKDKHKTMPPTNSLFSNISREGTCTVEQLSEDEQLEIGIEALQSQIKRLENNTKNISKYLIVEANIKSQTL